MLANLRRRRTVFAVVGGAVGLSVASRLLGLLRELLIVGRIGVHDYTDAYFATSTVVLWLQNYSFGAYTLYFVPKFLSFDPAERQRWFRRRVRVTFLLGSAAAVVFVIAYP